MMNKKMMTILLILLLTVFFLPGISSGIGLEIAGGVWGDQPSGHIQSDAVSSADRLDVERDFGYDRDYRVFGRAKVDMPILLPDIYLMATPLKFEETGSKDISFKFGDRTFNANVPFDSMLKLDHYDITLFYPLPLLQTASLKTLNLELGINARIIDFEARIDQETTGLSESESMTFVLPMLYAGIQISPASMLSLEAEARGIVYNSDHYYDLTGRVILFPVKPFFIAGGYRYENIEIERNEVETSVRFAGPFIEAGVSF